MVVNFDFLKQTNPKLYQLGHEMEENMYTNDELSLHFGGEFLNELVREIFHKQGLNYIDKSFMTKDIEELQRNKIITGNIYALFEKAKWLKDKSELDDSNDRLIELHSVLARLAVWFFDKYEKGINN